jgi:large repetitive protein
MKKLAAALLLTGLLNAQAIRTNPGFAGAQVPRNDDGSTALQPIGFTINFFGKQRTHAYVNNNGNITFDSALATFTPFGLENTQREIIAAFFADVDTRAPGSKLVTYGQDTISGRRAFGVNYVDVGYYNTHSDKLNSFQIVLIDRSDLGAGNFDIEYNYQRILWETGDASGGVNGYGGVPAAVGWSNGSGEPGTSFELDGSLIPGAFLDGARSSLIRNRLNSTVPGRFIFRARNGQILPPLTITTGCPLPSAFAATPYVLRFSAIGGTQYRWSMAADPGVSLPVGFTLSENGTFTGTPSGPGSSEFTVRLVSVTEDGEQTVSKRCSLSIQSPTLTITTGCPLPQATTGQTYSRTLQVSGGRAPYRWSLAEFSAPLPAGLSISANGALAGVPTSPGSSVVTFQVSSNEADGAVPAVKTCGLTVNPSMLDLTSSCSLPSATSGVPYSQQLFVEGGSAPYEWSASGSLPPGLSLSPDGRVNGVPTGQAATAFTAQVRDSRGSVRTQSCAIRVDVPVLDMTTACPLPPGIAGQPYSQQLAVAGGQGPYSWSVLGALPPGLTLNGDGFLSGSPGGAGPFGFRVLVTDSLGRATAESCSLTVARAEFGLTSCPLPNATAGVDYSMTMRADGGLAPYYFSMASALPAGLTLNSAGLLSGRPRQPGAFPINVRVMDSRGRTATQPCHITVNPTQLQISGSCPLPEAKVGTSYLQRFSATGGASPYVFRVDGRLPGGLAMAADGSLTGTPQSTANTDFEVEVTDSRGHAVARFCSLKVALPDIPMFRLSSMPATMTAAATGPAVTVDLSQPYSLPIQGELVLSTEAETGSFDARINRGDPRVRFSNGQRVLPFTLPPGARRISTQIVSTGTVASATTVKLVNVKSAGTPIYTLPSPTLFRVARTAPLITEACFTPTAGGVNVIVTGYSTTRQLTNATVTLTPASGGIEKSITQDVSGSGFDYFSTDEAIRNGGAFMLTLPFAVEGGEVNSATLELSNSAGSTAPRSLSRCR